MKYEAVYIAVKDIIISFCGLSLQQEFGWLIDSVKLRGVSL